MKLPNRKSNLLLPIIGLIGILFIYREDWFMEYKKHYGKTMSKMFLYNLNSDSSGIVVGILTLKDSAALRTLSLYGQDSLSFYSWAEQPIYFTNFLEVEVIYYVKNRNFVLIRYPNSVNRMDEIGAVYVFSQCLHDSLPLME